MTPCALAKPLTELDERPTEHRFVGGVDWLAALGVGVEHPRDVLCDALVKRGELGKQYRLVVPVRVGRDVGQRGDTRRHGGDSISWLIGTWLMAAAGEDNAHGCAPGPASSSISGLLPWITVLTRSWLSVTRTICASTC